MKLSKKALLFFLLTLLSHVFLFVIKNRSGFDFNSVNFQQDNYLGYAFSLNSRNFPQGISVWDNRLFPGLPFLIYLFNLLFRDIVVSGLVITLLGLTIIYFVAYYFTKQPIYSFWLTLFPPVIFELTSKISTENVVVALLLLFYYFFSKKKNSLATIIVGYAFLVRPIAACVFLALFISLLIKSEKTEALKSLFIFLVFPSLLALFNHQFWPQDSLFRQLSVYPEVVTHNLSFIQLFLDIARTINWGQWRILVSGVAYLVFIIWLFTKIARASKDFLVKDDFWLLKIWTMFTFLFIFTLGPEPFLEDMRRYFAVFFPLVLLANFKDFFAKKKLFYLSFLLSISAFI